MIGHDHARQPLRRRPLASRDEDLRLFETLANNASVALQYDRLEQAVRQLRELQEQLQHQAFHDSLTDLANRSLFINRVEDALAAAGARRVAVLFIDIDDFKTFNDSLGHAAGDELLLAVADRLRACLRPGDTVARLGGDEFALLLDRAGGEGTRSWSRGVMLRTSRSRIDVAGERCGAPQHRHRDGSAGRTAPTS